jgi:rhomboid family GlyGly-CTERM serine protease
LTRFAGGRLRAAHAWAGMAALLCVAALAGWPIEREALDWQPGLAFTQPWRAITAVAVHYNGIHLAGALAGTVLTGALGFAANVPARLVWAWLVAWPLTHFGLLVKPELVHYGGVSGVVHAGVAAVIVFLLVQKKRPQRLIGAAMLIGILIKVLGETPWGAALRHPEGWGIAVAPIGHATGALAGAFCALVALLIHSPHRPDSE